MRRILPLLLFAVLVVQPITVRAAPTKIVLIVMENHAYEQIVGSTSAPYLNDRFIPAGELFTNYSAITHPSLPNYLDLVAGTDSGCTSDSCSRDSITANNVYKQLKKHLINWRDWNESMPSNCYQSDSGDYVVHHNPPPYYTNLAATLCPNRDIPYPSTLPTSLPPFLFITPNNCSNMHDCSISTGDTWLSNHVPALLAKGSTVIITWDEDDRSHGNHVLTAMVGPGVTAGSRDNTAYNHYGLLAGIEDHFGLSRLANAVGATAVPIP